MRLLKRPPCLARLTGRAGLLVALVLAAGCGSGTGKLSGKVTFQGKPVPGGWVIFRPADGRENTVNAQLDENGNYEAVVPGGEVKIAVDNRELKPIAHGRTTMPLLPGFTPPAGFKPPPPPANPESSPDQPVPPVGRYLAFPEKYCNVDTSELKHTVKSGTQTHDIELK